MKRIKIFFAIFLSSMLLASCGSVNTNVGNPPLSSTASAEPAGTPTPTETSVPSPSVTPSPTPEATPEPTPEPLNDTGKTLIRKDTGKIVDDICILIISKNGKVLACDPTMPLKIIPDYALVTHDHHLNDYSYKNYPNAQIVKYKKGNYDMGDFKVTGIPASHTDFKIDTEKPSFVVYLIEVDGLRIAYFACCGQKELTAEQMDALGSIDIACITADDYPGFISVDKAAGLMKQLNPKVIVPLSHGYTPLKDAVSKLKSIFGNSETVEGGFAVDTGNIDEYAQYKVVNIEVKK